MTTPILSPEALEAVAAKADFGRASARKTGRNPRWPYVPVLLGLGFHVDGSGQRQLKGLAYATRAEAVAAAERHIAAARADLAAKLADPRYRALREQLRPASGDRPMTPADNRHVSRVLAAAGLPRAGRYTPFGGYVDGNGRPQDGFIAHRGYDTTSVLTTLKGDAGAALVDAAEKALVDAGFVVEREGRVTGNHEVRSAQSLRVWKS